MSVLNPAVLPLALPKARVLEVIVRRTDGGRFDHVADGESLDCLVLGSASRTVAAANRLDVAAALLVTTAVVLLALPLFTASTCRCCILGRALLDHGGLILASS